MLKIGILTFQKVLYKMVSKSYVPKLDRGVACKKGVAWLSLSASDPNFSPHFFILDFLSCSVKRTQFTDAMLTYTPETFIRMSLYATSDRQMLLIHSGHSIYFFLNRHIFPLNCQGHTEPRFYGVQFSRRGGGGTG